MDIKMGPVMGKAPAVVGTIEIHPGQRVAAGQLLAQVETGKGNRPIKAPADGIIDTILCAEGEQVISGQTLFILTESSGSQENDENTVLKTDLFIIGGGPGGYVAALYASKSGMSVVLAEKELLGGTCLNCGCIPTKALIQSAQLFRQIRLAGAFGISVTDASLIPEQVFRRKEDICSDLRDGVASLLESANVTVLNGTASFTGKTHCLVRMGEKTRTVEFKNAIIASGSQPSLPPFARALHNSSLVMDSRQALDAGTFPGSVTIIGAGVIGMEFAFLYRSAGAAVYVIEFQPRILGNTDDDIAGVILDEARKQSISVYTGAKVTDIRRTVSGQAVVTFEQNGASYTAVTDVVLTATGRQPYTEGLNLEAAGISVTEQGAVWTSDFMETSVPGIYAIGDVTGKSALAHAASHQGIAVVDTVIGKGHAVDHASVPSVIFTSPEAACAGLTEHDCRNRGIPYIASRFAFAASGKAKIMGETVGFVKLLCHKETRQILGGTVVGPDASALIGTITLAVKNKLTDAQLTQTVFAHPTTSEAVFEAAMGLSCGALHQST